MTPTLAIVGIEREELDWLRLLVSLLRHPDPVVSELTRQALVHIRDGATPAQPSRANSLRF